MSIDIKFSGVKLYSDTIVSGSYLNIPTDSHIYQPISKGSYIYDEESASLVQVDPDSIKIQLK